MKLRCLSCGHEFNGGVSYDELGWHSTCPKCESSFDVDLPDGRIAVIFITAKQFASIIASAPMDTIFDFTFDQDEGDFSYEEPQGWHCAKITTIFDESDGYLPLAIMVVVQHS